MIYCNYCLCLETDAETGNQLLNSEHLRNMYYVIVLVALTQANVTSTKFTALLPSSHHVFIPTPLPHEFHTSLHNSYPFCISTDDIQDTSHTGIS